MRPRRPPRPPRLLACGALAAACAACAASPTDTPGPPATPGLEATPDPNAIVWALSSAPQTLDPSRMGVDEGAAQVAAQVYDRLFDVVERPDGTIGLTGDLAESWESDIRGRTYTFTLRPDLRFHDGTPLDAPAVKWNVERWMDPDHEAHDGIFRGWRAMFGGYVGENDASDRPRNLVERVEALDARTLRITLRASFAPLPHHLATAAFAIASPDAVRAQGADYGMDGAHLPVGSGPFRVVAWDKAAGTVQLVRFEERALGRAASPGVRFRTIADPAERAVAVAAGQVGGADLPAGFALTETIAAGFVRAVPRPARATSWLVLNVARAPLDDARVRQAMSLALDREAILADHFGPDDLPAGQLLPPGIAGHDPSIAPPRRDLARARALMAEAGVADGFRLNIWVAAMPRPYLPDPEGTGAAIAAMLGEIGIEAEAQPEPMRRVLERRTSGRGTAWLLGWEAQSLDPDNFWYWHFSPSRAPAEGQYVNPTLGALLLEAQQSIVPDARGRAYRAAAQEVARDAPRLFLAHARSSVLLKAGVEGFVPGPLGFDDLSGVTGATGRAAAPTDAPPAAALTPSPSAPTAAPGAPEVAGDGDGDAGPDSDPDSDPAATTSAPDTP